MKFQSRHGKISDGGFTLVELLIVMAIFMLVMIPVMTAMTNSYESYLLQDDVAEAQQAARIGMMRMVRDIRMAGAGMEGFTEGFTDPAGTRIYAINFQNNFDDEGPDRLTVSYMYPYIYDPESGQSDIDMCSVDQNGNTYAGNLLLCSEMPVLSLAANALPGDNQLQVTQDLTTGLAANWGPGGQCYCGGRTYSIDRDMPVLVTESNGKLSNLLWIDGASTANTPNVLTYTDPFNNVLPQEDIIIDGIPGSVMADLPGSFRNDFSIPATLRLWVAANQQYENPPYQTNGNFPQGSTISFFNWEAFISVEYFLDDENRLMRQENSDPPQILADNVFDLQFSFVGDFDFNSATTGADPELQNFGVPPGSGLEFINGGALLGAFGGDEPDAVQMVRVSILTRTDDEYSDIESAGRPAKIEDHTLPNATDNFQWRLIEETVKIRNFQR